MQNVLLNVKAIKVKLGHLNQRSSHLQACNSFAKQYTKVAKGKKGKLSKDKKKNNKWFSKIQT